MAVLLPRLPQDDLSFTRRNRLEQARNTYQFNYEHIPSLAISDQVPFGDLPQLEWLLKVIGVLLNIEVNALAIDHNTDLDVPSNNLEESLQNIYDSIGVKEPLEVMNDLLALLEIARPVGRPRNLDDYELLFQTVEIPEAFNQLLNDDVFAELRVAGPNPLVIQQINSLDERFPVTDDIFQATPEFANDTLLSAGNEGRLYLADYALFDGMTPGALPEQPKYVYAPLALFARPRNGDKLKAVAIQCQQAPNDNPIYTPNDGWSWQLAKAAVQVADSNHHELVSHLGTTHLVLEPIGVSTHRQLSYRHPLFLLLSPHFEGTIFINNLAHQILLPEGTPVPVLLSGDTASLHQQAIDAVKNYSFKDSYLPAVLQARGVSDTTQLPHYPYRDDALKIWNSIHDWVSEYLSIYYDGDSDVQRDTEVQAWAAEINSQDGGRLHNFGDNGGFGTLSSLVDATTMIIFTASAQHAAVNFPQASRMTYVPLYPLAGYQPSPTATNHTADDFLNMFAPMDNAAEQLDVLTLLGSVYHTQLGQYSLDHFLDLRVVAPLQRFKNALEIIENDIEARNLNLDTPYNTLRPSNIPQSTNI